MKVFVYNKLMNDFYFKTEYGVTTLHCKALDETGIFRHCFTTRRGGVSRDYLSSMNLSFAREAKENVMENYRRLARAEGFCKERFTLTDQVHADFIRAVDERTAGMGMSKPSDIKNTDGLITALPETPLAAFIADCGGILLADPVHRAAAAVHSGWRGTLGRISANALRKMSDLYGTDPQDVIAAIGPCIGPCCYEVGAEVREAFLNAWQDDSMFKPGKNGKYMLDLWQANRLVLQKAGVPDRQIHCAEMCTMCRKEEFYSHRATGGKRGNMAAIIEIRRQA